MAGPQFMRLQSFSRKPNKGGQSVGQVIDEVEREPEFSLHVANPEPPNLVYGITPREALKLHDEMLERSKTKVTLKDGRVAERGIRQDRHTLLGAVASHPYTSRMVRDLDAPRAEYEDWKRRTVEWLRERYGDQLKCVVEHLDEEHPHLHAYILPDTDPNCAARTLNPAYAAKEQAEAEAKAEGKDLREAVKIGNNAYKAAARALQDDYGAKVGRPCALTRTGPKRARLSRQQWKEAKTVATREKEALERVREALTLPERVEAAIALVSAVEPPRAPLEHIKHEVARRCLEAVPTPLWGDHRGSLGPLVSEDVTIRGKRVRDRQIDVMRLSSGWIDSDGNRWGRIRPPEDLSIFGAAKWWAEFDQKWAQRAESLIFGEPERNISGMIFYIKQHVTSYKDFVLSGKNPEPTANHISHILEAFREVRKAVWDHLKEIIAPQIAIGQALAVEIEAHLDTKPEPPPQSVSRRSPGGPSR